MIFGLGYIENPEDEKWDTPNIINKTRAKEMMARYPDNVAFDSAFAVLGKSWRELLDGVVLQQPAYTHYRLNLGEISSYPPGYKENAGVFCHNNTWITVAEAALGNGERAWELYKKICPAYLESVSEIHRTEPYVYSQMVAGRDAPTFGEGKNSWLTGTAAWTLLSITQAILGITPTLDGLSVVPVLPAELKAYDVVRSYRGAVYRIHVENRGGKTVRLSVDGNAVAGTVLPVAPAGSEVSVTAVLSD